MLDACDAFALGAADAPEQSQGAAGGWWEGWLLLQRTLPPSNNVVPQGVSVVKVKGFMLTSIYFVFFILV